MLARPASGPLTRIVCAHSQQTLCMTPLGYESQPSVHHFFPVLCHSDGRSLKSLNMSDERSRLFLAILEGRRHKANDVITTPEVLTSLHPVLAFIRTLNGLMCDCFSEAQGLCSSPTILAHLQHHYLYLFSRGRIFMGEMIHGILQRPLPRWVL